MNTTAAVAGKAVPAWLHDVFLGYGDPKQAHYRSLALEGQVNRYIYDFMYKYFCGCGRRGRGMGGGPKQAHYRSLALGDR